MHKWPTIISTAKGLVEVKHSIKEYKKTRKTKILASVARHTDPFVKEQSASITVKPTEDIAAAVNTVDNRLAAKINAYYIKTLPVPEMLTEIYDEKLITNSTEKYLHSPWHYICPLDWRSADTRELYLKYFRKHFLELLSKAVAANAYGPTVDEEIRTHILDEVKKNILRKDKAEDLSDEALTERAKIRANDHIENCNFLYSAFRLEIDNYLRYPEVHVPQYSVDRQIKAEQCKALDWEVLVTLAALLRLCMAVTPLALGGILMMCSMLRTAEATAPQFGDILFFENFAVYAVLWQSDGSVRIADLKSDSAYRLVIIPKFALDCILKRMEELRAQGISEDALKHAYVVSASDDPFRPANPNELSSFVRKLLTEIGCSEDFWAAAAELMHREPDELPNGKPLSDLLCYVLRRSGCTYLCNCSGLDPCIVDVIMGHLLRREDMHFTDEVKREEIWAMIADHMECIVLDPEHSAHPAFSPREMTPVSPSKIIRAAAHSCFQLRVTDEMIKAGTIRLVVDTLECGDIEVGYPIYGAISKVEATPTLSPSDYPCISEHLSRENFEKLKAEANKIFEDLFPQ